MNRYQRLIVVVALINALVMVLFPPFNDSPLSRGALPSFEGFYPLLTQWGRKAISEELLTIELMFLAANALAAFLCLVNRGADELPRFRFALGIACFVAVNLAIILLFPPFEPYSSFARVAAGTFDSFNFVWGIRSARPIFAPMLYLEIILVTVNALALWLLFNSLQRGDDAMRTRLLALAERMDENELAQLTETMRRQVDAHHEKMTLQRLGRGLDRRRDETTPYPGGERRQSHRRHRGEAR